MPLFGSVMAVLFLGEAIQLFHIVGALLIGMGLWLSLHSSKTKQPKIQ
jgi:drug/metabolite transporter (DMT)-like permease